MDTDVDMMGHMITVVECILIIEVVDRLQRKGTIELIRFQVLGHCCHRGVHKDVLTEVAKHQCKASYKHRNECCP